MPDVQVLGEAVEKQKGRTLAMAEAVDGYGRREGDIEGGKVAEHVANTVNLVRTLWFALVPAGDKPTDI